MKFCKDCTHFKAGDYADTNLWAECIRLPPTVEVSLVTGEPRPGKPIYCATERGYLGDSHCGQTARFFQPKTVEAYASPMTPTIVEAVKALED